MSDFPSPSEQQFRQRVRDLEACATFLMRRETEQAMAMVAMRRDNARLRRALRTLAKLQPERVRRAVMEVVDV